MIATHANSRMDRDSKFIYCAPRGGTTGAAHRRDRGLSHFFLGPALFRRGSPGLQGDARLLLQLPAFARSAGKSRSEAFRDLHENPARRNEESALPGLLPVFARQAEKPRPPAARLAGGARRPSLFREARGISRAAPAPADDACRAARP